MDLAQRTTALYFYPIGSAIVTLAMGFVSDRWGRKAACGVSTGLALAGLVGYILTANPNFAPWITGLLYGISNGAYWTAGDTIGLIEAESVKTEIRSSAQSAFGLLGIIACMFSAIIMGIILGIAGDSLLIACHAITGIPGRWWILWRQKIKAAAH